MVDAIIVGCGYLGRRVAACLMERGLEVAGTTRSREKARELEAAGIEPVLLDVVEPGQVERLPDVDLVFHCVGYDRSAAASMRRVYVEGLERVLGQLEVGSGRLVFASSTGVYGQTDGSWVDEETEPEPRTESGRICLEAEQRVRRFAASGRWTATILRFSGLYGPGRLLRKSSLERGEPLSGDPDHWLNLVEIRDAARMASGLLTAREIGPVYVATDDRPLLRREFYETMASVLGTPAPRFEVKAGGSGRDATNKRVSNRKIKAALGVELLYPEARLGLRAAVEGDSG